MLPERCLKNNEGRGRHPVSVPISRRQKTAFDGSGTAWFMALAPLIATARNHGEVRR
jgi:hypothetical protein